MAATKQIVGDPEYSQFVELTQCSKSTQTGRFVSMRKRQTKFSVRQWKLFCRKMWSSWFFAFAFWKE